MSVNTSDQRGFTLVEMAIAMIIVGLLLGTGMMTLSAQQAQRYRSETVQTLKTVNETLMGFAIANGRLPCPATDSGGVESFAGAGAPVCAASEGYVPAISLGLSPRDREGYLLDGWNNRIHYAVATHVPNGAASLNPAKCPPNETEAPDFEVCPVYTTSQGLLSLGLGALPKQWAATNGMLRVCSSTCGSSEHAVAAVTWSDGDDGKAAPENANNDTTYVYPAEGESDDLIVWLSQYALFSRMRENSVF